jgi:hypothetical protein
MPADIDHAVDGRGAAEHSAPRMRQTPAVQMRFRIRHVVPIEPVGTQQTAHRRGHVDSPAMVLGSRLDQENTDLGIFGEAGGQHTAGGTRAHDDVVVGRLGHERMAS